MIALLLTVVALASEPCVAKGWNWLGSPRWEVRVVDGQVYRDNAGLYWGGALAPIAMLDEDTGSALKVRDPIAGEPSTRERPMATFDLATKRILHRTRGHELGRVDLSVAGASYRNHLVELSGTCSPSDAFLAVVASHELRDGITFLAWNWF